MTSEKEFAGTFSEKLAAFLSRSDRERSVHATGIFDLVDEGGREALLFAVESELHAVRTESIEACVKLIQSLRSETIEECIQALHAMLLTHEASVAGKGEGTTHE